MKPIAVLPVHAAALGQRKRPKEHAHVKAMMALFATAFFSLALWTSVEAFLVDRPFAQVRSDREYGHPLSLTLSSWRITTNGNEGNDSDEAPKDVTNTEQPGTMIGVKFDGDEVELPSDREKSLDILAILDELDNETAAADDEARSNELLLDDRADGEDVDVSVLERAKRQAAAARSGDDDDLLPVPSTKDINAWPGFLRFKNPPYPGYRECKPESEGIKLTGKQECLALGFGLIGFAGLGAALYYYKDCIDQYMCREEKEDPCDGKRRKSSRKTDVEKPLVEE